MLGKAPRIRLPSTREVLLRAAALRRSTCLGRHRLAAALAVARTRPRALQPKQVPGLKPRAPRARRVPGLKPRVPRVTVGTGPFPDLR